MKSWIIICKQIKSTLLNLISFSLFFILFACATNGDFQKRVWAVFRDKNLNSMRFKKKKIEWAEDDFFFLVVGDDDAHCQNEHY